MSLESTTSWLKFLSLSELDDEIRLILLRAIGLPELIFDASWSTLTRYVPADIAMLIRHGPSNQCLDQIEKTLNWMQEERIQFASISDSNYPSRLLNVPYPPLAFFAVGDLSLLNRPTVSLVGSRHPTDEGISTARSWAKSLIQEPLTLVQGMGSGIEYAAVQGAAQSKRGFVVVSNRALSSEDDIEKVSFMRNSGLMMSVTLPFGDSDRESAWLQRQKMMIAACEHFVVVEASLFSKSLRLAREAGDVGRNVMAVPGSIHETLHKGCHQLIREGAKLVESTQDIVKEMGLRSL